MPNAKKETNNKAVVKEKKSLSPSYYSPQKSKNNPQEAKEEKSRKTALHANLRLLTVYRHHVPCSNRNTGLKEIPLIRLTGIWLEKAGFRVNDKVEVIVNEKLVIIRPVVA